MTQCSMWRRLATLAAAGAAMACQGEDIIRENAVEAAVRVIVTDPAGAPVSGASVVIHVYDPGAGADPQPRVVSEMGTTDSSGEVTFRLGIFLAPPCDCPSEARVAPPPGSDLAPAIASTSLRFDAPAPPAQVIAVTLPALGGA